MLIHEQPGNVVAYAVQMAKQAGLHIVASAGTADLDYVRGVGASSVVNYKKERFEHSVRGVDVVLNDPSAC